MINDEQLAVLAQAVSDKFFLAEQKILEKIAEKIKMQGDSAKLSATDVYKIQTAYNYGADLKEMQRILARETGKAYDEIVELLNEVASDGYNFSKPFYQAKGLGFIPLKENKQLQRYVTSLAKTTLKSMENYSNTTLMNLIIDDEIVPFDKAYKDIIDRAIESRTLGTDFYKNMREVMNEVGHNGMVEYVSGAKRRMDTAVKYNLLDTMHTMNQEIQDRVGEEIGSDGIQITSHSLCAEDHQHINGRRYSNEEFEKIDSGLERRVGTKGCRHKKLRIILGVNEEIYSEEEIQKALDESNRIVKIGDKEVTRVQARQMQNTAGLNVRRAKEQLAMAEKSGDADWIAQKKKVLKDRRKVYNEISEKADLVKSRWQTSII